MVACALLDAVERGNAYVLRCKFPEFAKMNLLLLTAGFLLLVWSMTDGTGWITIIACCAAGVAVVKLTDVVLSLRKGLAIVVIGFAIANAALVGFALARAPAGCRLLLPAANARMRDVVAAACGHLTVTIVVATAATVLLTLLLYSAELARGLKDLGFVAAAMTGERKRRFGI
jgi:rhomboid protease GluP